MEDDVSLDDKEETSSLIKVSILNIIPSPVATIQLKRLIKDEEKIICHPSQMVVIAHLFSIALSSALSPSENSSIR